MSSERTTDLYNWTIRERGTKKYLVGYIRGHVTNRFVDGTRMETSSITGIVDGFVCVDNEVFRLIGEEKK